MTSPDAGFLNMLKVSFFLAYRSIKRTNIGTTILTVSIISFVFSEFNFSTLCRKWNTGVN